VARLGDLVRTLLPLARQAGGDVAQPNEATLDREVFWVRVLRARVPPFDSLEAGDLVIVPAAALDVAAPTAAGAEALGVALARARVAAIVMLEDGGDADAASGPSEALTTAASAAGVPVLRSVAEDPVALERSVIGFLVNRRAEIERRAAALEADLARLSLAGRGLDDLAAAIGAFLGRAVAIEGRRGDPIAVHAPAELPGGAAAVSRYLAKPSAVALRVPIAAPAGERGSGGHLALLGAEPASELERMAGERVSTLLALELARDAAVRDAREQTRRAEPLPADGPPWAVIVARQVVTTAPLDAAARERTRAELRALVSPRRLSLRGTSESLELRLVAATPPDDRDGLAIAGRIASFLGRAVAVSRPFSEPAERPAAEAAARTTLEAIEALDEPPAVGRAGRLPAYRLISNVRNLPDGQRQARELLAPILVGREAAQRERLRTLQAVLETASLAEAAVRLGVHRNTIAYRVERLHVLGGWDLSDPDLRFALSLAARLLRR
jgi:PucR family transcriptional regulator, purine catabolism regulatory protein